MKSLPIVLAASLVAITVFTGCTTQKKIDSKFSFAFYNLENLFDTINDPTIDDESFLPDARNPWNSERYLHKLDQMSKVMADIDSTGFPALLGLCEVENKEVLTDLVKHGELRAAAYSIIHQNSPDERGIDVALLYQPGIFSPVSVRYIPVVFPENPDNKTRDILYAKGLVKSKDTLHVFINHWVSRWGGQAETEPSRKFIAGLLKTITDSIMRINPEANIIIAGDLNDNPSDISVSQVLQAKQVTSAPDGKSLYNLSLSAYEQGEGSLYYKSWDMFDQIIVSSAMLTGVGGIKVSDHKQTVVKHDYLLFKPKNGEPRPNRTASGKNYFGGFSDHLPVMIELNIIR